MDEQRGLGQIANFIEENPKAVRMLGRRDSLDKCTGKRSGIVFVEYTLAA